MTSAATARLLIVCLAAAPATASAGEAEAAGTISAAAEPQAAAPEGSARPASLSPRVEARRPPPAVLVLPLMGPVLLPLALPTTVLPARRKTVELPLPAGERPEAAAPHAAPEVQP